MEDKNGFILKCSNCNKEFILKDCCENKDITIHSDYEHNIIISCSCGNEIYL